MTSLRCHAMAVVMPVLFASACMTDDASHQVALQSEALGDGSHSEPIAWAACPSDFASECAWVPLPVNHEEPEGPALPIFVSHAPARSGHAKAQLWMLQGGPGGSGSAFTRLIASASEFLPDTEFFVLEHRGVGESARLGCAAEESPNSDEGQGLTTDEWPACVEAVKAQWGEQLDYFSTTQDAYDLGSLIKRTRVAGRPVFVFGVSYGTTRALRFLQTHPALVDGVILDSVVSPGVQFLSEFDEQFDVVGKDLAKLCAEDPQCGEHMGSDPWARIVQLIDKLDRGHCPAFMHRSLVRPGFAQLLMARELRAHIFPLAYRLERCEPLDIAVVDHYLSVFSGLSGEAAADRESPVLQNHVALSELWEDPAPSYQTLVERCDSQLLCPGVGPYAGHNAPFWPTYEQDQFANQWPETETPILAMNGTLDPQTPIGKAEAVEEHLHGEHQHFVTVPWSPHGVFASSPVATKNTPDCGFQMMYSFLSDPSAMPDTTCLSDLLPPFVTDPQVDAQFFGGLPQWDNPAPSETQQLVAAGNDSLTGVDARAFVVRPLMLPRISFR